eukprot:2728815-Rhodomonas_salina.3
MQPTLLLHARPRAARGHIDGRAGSNYQLEFTFQDPDELTTYTVTSPEFDLRPSQVPVPTATARRAPYTASSTESPCPVLRAPPGTDP